MIDRQYGKIIIGCDTCDATVESEAGEGFKEFWPKAKAEGWRAEEISVTNAKSEWMHVCPTCNR